MCLDDTPAKEVIGFPAVLPGVLYDVGHQCRLQYGAYSVFCDGMDVSAGPPGPGPARGARDTGRGPWRRLGLGGHRPRAGFWGDCGQAHPLAPRAGF